MVFPPRKNSLQNRIMPSSQELESLLASHSSALFLGKTSSPSSSALSMQFLKILQVTFPNMMMRDREEYVLVVSTSSHLLAKVNVPMHDRE
jgi:hypothetical protein